MSTENLVMTIVLCWALLSNLPGAWWLYKNADAPYGQGDAVVLGAIFLWFISAIVFGIIGFLVWIVLR
jgi:hypothetical protein